jgi:hypothetical protein
MLQPDKTGIPSKKNGIYTCKNSIYHHFAYTPLFMYTASGQTAKDQNKKINNYGK